MRIAAVFAIFVLAASAASAQVPLILDAKDAPDYIARVHPIVVWVQTQIDPRTTLIFYCQDGARSSLGALAAVQAAYPYVRLYYLSYLDWQSDPNDPVEK